MGQLRDRMEQDLKLKAPFHDFQGSELFQGRNKGDS